MKSLTVIAGLIVAGSSGVLGQYPSPPAPTQPSTVANCLTWHVVSAGDTCLTIETAFGITHTEFLAWNPDVNTECTVNFWGTYAYCVGAPPAPIQPGTATNCNAWHVVTAGQTCAVVETAAGITHAQFLAWNPAVNEACTLNFWGNYAYCVGVRATTPITKTTTTSRTTTTSSSTTSSSTTSTRATVTTTSRATNSMPYSIRYPVTSETIVQPTIDTAWPPTKTQAGQPSYCNNWHLVLPGQTCDDIAVIYDTWMGLANLQAWNPALGSDCSGLYVYHYVCVGIQPQTSLSVVWNTANATSALPDYVSVTSTPLPTYDYQEPFVPTPTQGPLPTDCLNWYQAQPSDTCEMLLGLATEEQFMAWHPFLNGNCNGLWAGNYYCTWAGSELPPPPTVTDLAIGEPVKPWITVNCNRWYQAVQDTCQSIVDMFGRFSLTEFTQWNPAVGTACASGIEDDFYYCVGVPGSPTTRTAAPVPIPTGTVPDDDPIQTQPGIAADCTVFQLVHLDDTCARITSRNGISLADFLAWNPSIGTDATAGCTNLLPNYHVCVSVTGEGEEGATTTTMTTATPEPSSATTTSSSAVPATTTATGGSEEGGATPPSPVQAGITTSCRRYYLVQENDGCWAIANAAGIQLSDFNLWNPDLNTGGECWGLWLGYYVCIGISGPVTTISAGPPLPTNP